MYNTQEIAGRIKFALKEQGITNQMLSKEMGIGINAISEFSGGKAMSCIKLAEIADFLNLSVDDILGRPSPHVTIGDISGNNSGNAGNTNCTFGAPSDAVPPEALEIAEMLSGLSFKDRAQLMTMISDFVESHKK